MENEKQWLSDALPELLHLHAMLENSKELQAHASDKFHPELDLESMLIMLNLTLAKLRYFETKHGFKVEDAEQVWPAKLLSMIDVEKAMERYKESGLKPW